jgi:hypothetical protein
VLLRDDLDARVLRGPRRRHPHPPRPAAETAHRGRARPPRPPPL